MYGSIRFAGACPTCGRSLHIPIDLHGKQVCCHGCGAEFRAIGAVEHIPSADPCPSTNRGNLDRRVDSLLAAADRQLDQPCLHSQTSR